MKNSFTDKRKKNRPKMRTKITKETMIPYYAEAGGQPEVGQVRTLQAEDSPEKQVEVLSVSLTHVFVRFPDTKLKDNIPHYIFRLWLKNAQKD